MPDLERFISGLLPDSSDKAGNLLQFLCAIQQHYSHIPEAAVHLLADWLHTPPIEILAVVDFYSFLHRQDRGDFDIYFSDNITDRMLGNQSLLDSFCRKLGVEPSVPRAEG